MAKITRYSLIDRQFNTAIYNIMVQQTFTLLSVVSHVLPTQFSKNNITIRTVYGTRDDSASFLCSDSMCACSSLVQLT